MPDLVEVSDSEEEGGDDDDIVEVPAPDGHRCASASTSATANSLPAVSVPVDDGMLLSICLYSRKLTDEN